MPVYNSETFLEQAIQSVILQTYSDWELIIVDDGSRDQSVQIAQKYSEKDGRIRFIRSSENRGAAAARNLGIHEAKGRFIAFLDSDDLWLPNKLKVQFEAFNKMEASLIYSSYLKVDSFGKVKGKPVLVPERVTYNQILRGNVIGCLTAVYDTFRVGKVYMPDIKLRQDYGLWLSILKSCEVAHGITEPLALYRIHNASISSNKLKAAYYQWKVYRDLEKLSLFDSIQLFFSYAVYGLRKYFQ